MSSVRSLQTLARLQIMCSIAGTSEKDTERNGIRQAQITGVKGQEKLFYCSTAQRKEKGYK